MRPAPLLLVYLLFFDGITANAPDFCLHHCP
jgi:hypothetical protein